MGFWTWVRLPSTPYLTKKKETSLLAALNGEFVSPALSGDIVSKEEF